MKENINKSEAQLDKMGNRQCKYIRRYLQRQYIIVDNKFKSRPSRSIIYSPSTVKMFPYKQFDKGTNLDGK